VACLVYSPKALAFAAVAAASLAFHSLDRFSTINCY